MAPFSWSFRVRFHECDPQGIVFNAHYLAYLDMTWTEILREVSGGVGYTQMVAEHGVDLVVAEAALRFRGPARFDDLVEVTAEITRLGTTATTTTMAVRREGRTLVEGELRHVWVDAATWEKAPIPAVLRERLGRFAAPGAAA